jgi:hypothetical protein
MVRLEDSRVGSDNRQSDLNSNNNLSCGMDSWSMLPPARSMCGGWKLVGSRTSSPSGATTHELVPAPRSQSESVDTCKSPLHHRLSRLGLLQAPPTRPGRKSQTLPRRVAFSLQTNATPRLHRQLRRLQLSSLLRRRCLCEISKYL